MNRPPVADPVAGIMDQCLLCGGHAYAYSADDGRTVEVWELCRPCNSAFHFLAVGLELLQAMPGPAAVDQVPLAAATIRCWDDKPGCNCANQNPGQLELDQP